MTVKKNVEEKVDSITEVANFKKLPLDPFKVKKGDLMAFVYYGKVESVTNGGNFLSIKWLDKIGGFNVDGTELVKDSFSADQFEEEKKVNQTDCIDILMKSYNKPFTVCFVKQDEEERVLRGRLVTTDGKRGRSMCEDLDLPGPEVKRLRQVDHRTLKWFIVDGIKFVVGRK